MIPALIMGLIALFLGGDSPYLIPNMDKHVKKYVIEKEEKKQLGILLKDAQKEHKAYLKTEKSEFKHLNEILNSRDSKAVDFNEALVEMNKSRGAMQANKRGLLVASASYINDQEWVNMQVGINKDITKLVKKFDKSKIKLEKQFDKTHAKLNKIIVDEDNKANAIQGFDKFKKEFFLSYDFIIEKKTDDKSVLYDYKVTDSQILEYQDLVNDEMDKILKSFVTLHFILVEASTPTEWKKIKNVAKRPF